jgi:hypothetical protein
MEKDLSKYVTEMDGYVTAYYEEGVYQDPIGKFSFISLNLEQAIYDRFSIFEIFDHSEHLLTIGESIFDFIENRYLSFDNGFDEPVFGDNLMVFNFFEILPAFRGEDLTPMIIKDAVSRFGHGCAFVVFRLFTLQHVNYIPENDDDHKWIEELELQKFVQDEEHAYYKLAAYFQKFGFVNIVDDIFGLNMGKKNYINEPDEIE